MSVRVRLAPSPTGEPHVGTMRTAIFDWLLAQHEGGQCVVRVEDTDRARFSPEAVDSLLNALQWLGIDPDEGPTNGGPFEPYVQSERLPLYQDAAERLIRDGGAYRCYCSTERLDEMRLAQQNAHEPPRYDRRCRGLTQEDRASSEARGLNSVVRFKVPEHGETRVEDYIRGEITFANATQDDFVILKSDGYPTYHLAVVVDDHAMQITHVLRGDEWLPSFPKHILLYAALGYDPPVFAHLPLILGPDRKKLSKRHGDTAFSSFQREGYLPEALFNFLGLLGWSLDDKTEIISRGEFIRHFSLERISKSPAIFDIDKLRWMNGHYIRSLPPNLLGDHVAQRLDEDLDPTIKRPLARELVDKIVPLIQERIKLLSELAELTGFFFSDAPYDYALTTLLGKRLQNQAPLADKILASVVEEVTPLPDWNAHELEHLIEPLCERFELKRGDLYGLVRVAITGRTVTPPLFESMEVLGRGRCIARLGEARAMLSRAVEA